MSNVVLYLRYSSDKQTEQSIEGQRRVCEEFCRRSDYTIVGEYIDRALTASKETDKRRDFNRMIADAAKGKFKAVVVYKLDRFARNRYDSATCKAKLKRHGVRVISATEAISESPEGIILESVLEGLAEYYSAELSQKVTRGMTETALKGNSCGGTLPLGYRVKDKKLVVYEPEAAIVREAFDLFVHGNSYKEIIAIFNRKGYKTSKGKPFNKCSFSTMFSNKKYIGIYTYNDIEIEGGVPAIVSKEVFNQAQARRATYQHAPGAGKAKVDYLLSQKIICGHCGAKMVGSYGTSGTGEKYYYYVCPTQRRHKCDKTPVPKDEIENRIARHLYERLTPEFIDTLADMAIAQNRKDIEGDPLIPALLDEIKNVEAGINNLTRVLMQGLDSPTIVAKVKELEEEKKSLHARLEEAEGKYLRLEKVHVVWWLSKFADGDLDDEKYRRSLFDMLLNSVTVWNDPDGGYKVTIAYNLTDRPTETVGSDMVSSGSPNRPKPNFYIFGSVWTEALA